MPRKTKSKNCSGSRSANQTKKQQGSGFLDYKVGDVCALKIPYSGDDLIASSSRSKSRSRSRSRSNSDSGLKVNDYQLVSFYIKHKKSKGLLISSKNLKEEWMHMFTIQVQMVTRIEFIKPKPSQTPSKPFEHSKAPISDSCNYFCGANECESGESVRECYKGLALKYHPDKNPSGVGKMQEIQKTYDDCKEQSEDVKNILCGGKKGGSRSKSTSHEKQTPLTTNQVKTLLAAERLRIEYLPAVALFMDQSKEYKSKLEDNSTYVRLKKIANINKSPQKISKSKSKIQKYLQKLIGPKDILLCQYKAAEETVYYDQRSSLFELKHFKPEDKEKDDFLEILIDNALQQFNQVYLKNIDFKPISEKREFSFV